MNVQGISATAVPLAAASTSSTNSTGSTSSSSSASSSNSQLTQGDFLQLIATELKSQDPTNPLDPSQFMGQLVQFGTLQQVTGIYNLLANGATATAGTQAPASPGSSTSPSSASSPVQGL